MNNPFDKLAQENCRIQQSSYIYSFWIKSILLTRTELVKLLQWYIDPKHSNIVDKSGKIRKAIARQLPDDILFSNIKDAVIDSYPETLAVYLRCRYEAYIANDKFIDDFDEDYSDQ